MDQEEIKADEHLCVNCWLHFWVCADGHVHTHPGRVFFVLFSFQVSFSLQQILLFKLFFTCLEPSSCGLRAACPDVDVLGCPEGCQIFVGSFSDSDNNLPVLPLSSRARGKYLWVQRVFVGNAEGNFFPKLNEEKVV